MPTKPGKDLCREAFSEVKADRGIIHNVSQKDLDALTTFRCHNHGPFVSRSQATQEILDHNSSSRQPTWDECVATTRLRDLFTYYDDRWTPDIAIKCFYDLDLIFFNGRLRNNVTIRWRSPHAFAPHVKRGEFALGKTVETVRPGQVAMMLHAVHLLEGDVIRKPWKYMWATMLHEMCHAYEGGRVREGMQPGHGRDWKDKAKKVHKRAERLFGLWGIVPDEEMEKLGLH